MSTPLSERTDIHKSCKTLEAVVNILNDYCEAVNAIVQLQKKLAKALRESASTKCVAEIPANALNASAAIFETVSDVDVKFAKFADKECDGVSAEVKKWFKKLAKEERAHDEKIASANYKIKQAGQVYERKAKKNPRDAAEEHTRYINLLSSLGPEINREKYNHALMVTQKHASTLYSLAACVSRVADAEWARSCEAVRRFSPTVGLLGQWKALCEGGWSGPEPPDLPDANGEGAPGLSPNASGAVISTTVENGSLKATESSAELATPHLEKPAPEYTSRNASEQDHPSRAVTPSGQSPVPPPQYFPTVNDEPSTQSNVAPPPSTAPSIAPSIAPSTTSSVPSEDRKSHANILASLAAFPAPPTQFPTPRMGGSRFNSTVGMSSVPETPVDAPAQESHPPPFTRYSESPAPESEAPTPALTEGTRSPPTPRTELFTPPISNTSSYATNSEHSDNRTDSGISSSARDPTPEPMYSRTPTSPSKGRYEAERTGTPSVNGNGAPPGAYRRGDYADGAEFGMRRSSADGSRPRAPEPSLTKIVERTDTGKSTGSVVAALRDRYTRPTGAASPPPRELPRVPTSVLNLANRYEPMSSPPMSSSPVQERARPSLDGPSRGYESTSSRDVGQGARYAAPPATPSADELAMRRQRLEELEELELREREHELRMKEREIEYRARELERERLQLLNARGAPSAGESRARRISTTERERPALDTLGQGSRYPSSYSQSATQLPPARSPPTAVPESSASDHAPYCGCETCSASKYRAPEAGAPRDMRPPEAPIQLRPEKARGGWIRRLSMPVIAASFDSKKGVSPAGIAGGPGAAGYRSSMYGGGGGADEEGRVRSSAELGAGVRNRSSTNLARR